MTTAASSTVVATIQPAFTDAERLALAGFLAGYRGLTQEAYALDLRQFTTWCRRPAHAQACVHYRGAGCRSAAPRRARGRLPRGSADQSGSPGALPRRGPFRTGQAGFPRITAQASPVALRLMRWSSRPCVSSTRRG